MIVRHSVVSANRGTHHRRAEGIRVGEDRTGEVCTREVCATQVGVTQLRIGEGGPRQLCLADRSRLRDSTRRDSLL